MRCRIATFVGVGVVGFGVQMLMLLGLTAASWSPGAATAAAVEGAVLVNFLLHERCTWRERGVGPRALRSRLWRFHVANGLVSIGGNVTITLIGVRFFDLPVVSANLAAIALMSVVNFSLADRWVFVRHG